jgi:hypothetical protein
MKQCTCGRSQTYPYCDGTHKIKANAGILETVSAQIEASNKDNKVLFLKGFMKNSPEWKDFIGLIDHQYNNPLVTESTRRVYENSKTIVNGPSFILNNKEQSTNMYSMKNLDLHILFVKQINGVDHEWYDMPHIDTFLSVFGKKNIQNTVKSLINFTGNSLIGNIHSDKQDVASWTCAGEVEYRIYDVDKNETRNHISFEEAESIPYESYKMQSGDVIYMPRGTFHQAIAHSPRASLILDYD